MKSRALFVVCVAICAMAPIVRAPVAHAQSAAALKTAQAEFDAAQLAYVAGKYDEAADDFQKAYEARPFPQFLYNIGASYHMKGKASSDVVAYDKAVTYYKRYLSEAPNTIDKGNVDKAIQVLEAEIARIKAAAPTDATPASGSGSGSGSAAPTAPSAEVQQLGDVKVRGLVVVESEPSGAAIYLDDKKQGQLGVTPWSGSLEGEHKIIVEKRGYKVSEGAISGDPNKLFVLRVVMSEAGYLGWVEVSSNVPGADVFMDDKSVGAIGKTPLAENVKPGKHTFWISSDGYDEYTKSIDVVAGETNSIKADLNGAPVGKLNVLGLGIEDSTISLDGQVLCERGPCLRSVRQGDHVVSVTRPGFKPYTRKINIQAKTETQIKVGLAKRPGRSDAIVAYVLAAGFLGGGIYLGEKSNSLHDDLNKEISRGMPPPDSNDPRFERGKIYAISADVAFVAALATAGTALYYTLRDKGPDSQGLIDVRALALTPEVGPHYAGVGMEVHW